MLWPRYRKVYINKMQKTLYMTLAQQLMFGIILGIVFYANLFLNPLMREKER